MKKLLFVCAIGLAELSIVYGMGARSALACGSSWTICNFRARNHMLMNGVG
jgi:hypothetical protein